MLERYYVFNPEGGKPIVTHPSLPIAKAEAERLAIANPGKRFQVLLVVGECRKNEVIWDEIPYRPF